MARAIQNRPPEKAIQMTQSKPPIYLVAQRKTGVQLDGRVPPFGIMCVGESLRRAGHRVRLFHLLGEAGEQVLLKAVSEERPAFVGFSNCVSTTLRHDIAMSRRLHELGVKVVWGGVFPTSLPETTLLSGLVDYIVVGEGERPAPLLAQAIENGEAPEGIPGVGYLDGERPKIEPPLPIEPDLDRQPLGLDLVDWNDYVIMEQGGATRAASVTLSRGCPFGCSFCTNSMEPGRRQWRAYSLDYVREVADYLRSRHQIGAVYIQDDNPFGKLERGMRQVESLGMKWISAAHLRYVSADFLDWAKQCGCLNLSFGVESGSDRILEKMNKRTDRETILEKMRLCGEKKLASWAMWMAYVPGECVDDRRRTFELMEKIYEQNPLVQMHLSVYQAYPKTPFYEESRKLGLVEPETLDEWAGYTGRIAHLMGAGDRRLRRMALDLRALYFFERSRNRLHPWLRKVLKKRVAAASFAGPFEEGLHYARLVRDGLKNIVHV